MSTTARLPSIPGSPPEPGQVGQGCAFAPRCSMAIEACRSEPIPLRPIGEDRLARCIRAEEVPAVPVVDRVRFTRGGRIPLPESGVG